MTQAKWPNAQQNLGLFLTFSLKKKKTFFLMRT